MAPSISDLIEEMSLRIQAQAPAVQLFIKQTWSANQSDYRALIRQDLWARLKNLNENPSPEILDLKTPPIATNYSISISHCELAGGYALTKMPNRIGLDLEDCNRDVDGATNRISSQEEKSSAPSAMALWVAKESIVKAHQLPLISQAQVKTWKTLEENSEKYFYSFQPAQGGQGFVYKKGRLILGLTVIPA